jgi:adenosylcobinamide hydrolase
VTPVSVFDATVRDGVCRLRRPGTRWLSTGFDGGTRLAPAAYNVTVPEGFDRTDLAAYAGERRSAAAFEESGPTLLTGVAQRHARRARRGPVEAVATAGVSNPAALPMPRVRDPAAEGETAADATHGVDAAPTDTAATPGPESPDDGPPVGTVNLVVGTDRALAAGGLETLLAVVVEAKATTLLARTGFPGTTSDAVVVGCDPDGPPARFAGAATEVGGAARVCVRDAVLAALESRYAETSPPASVADATHGVVADGRATVSSLTRDDARD